MSLDEKLRAQEEARRQAKVTEEQQRQERIKQQQADHQAYLEKKALQKQVVTQKVMEVVRKVTLQVEAALRTLGQYWFGGNFQLELKEPNKEYRDERNWSGARYEWTMYGTGADGIVERTTYTTEYIEEHDRNRPGNTSRRVASGTQRYHQGIQIVLEFYTLGDEVKARLYVGGHLVEPGDQQALEDAILQAKRKDVKLY